MMKKLFLAITTLLSVQAFSQLHVEPNGTEASFLYVGDTFVFVEDDVSLETNLTATTNSGYPSILLRKQGQLLQGNGSTLNSGTGSISVFQEGTTDNYAYNFWSSPVGSPFGSAGNTNFSFDNLDNPRDVGNSQPALYQPGVDGVVTGAGDLRVATYWIWKYESNTGYSNWAHVSNTGSVEAGLGFTMKGVSGDDLTDVGEATVNNPTGVNAQRYDFRGRPHNGTITTAIGTEQNVLTGNPYPSALDLSFFLLQNSTTGPFSCGGVSATGTDILTGLAYFWESDPTVQSHYLVDYQGGYGTFSPMGDCSTMGMYMPVTFSTYDETGTANGTATGSGDATLERRFSPVGQGFFVRSNAAPAATVFTFENDQRVFREEGNNSDFKSNSESSFTPIVGVKSNYNTQLTEVSQIRINFNINDTYTRQLGVGLVDNATSGYDRAIDAKGINAVANDVSFIIDEEDKYLINALPFDENAMLPLAISIEDPIEIKINVGYTVAFDYEDIYLFDRKLDTYIDIYNGSAGYELDPNEDYTDRFWITFKDLNQEEEEEEESEEDQDEEDESEDEQDDEEEDEDGDTLSDEDSILQSFGIYQNNQAGQLEILNPKGVELNTVALYDITGKQIFDRTDLSVENKYIFPTRDLSDAIYVVRIVTENGFVKARKVRVKN